MSVLVGFARRAAGRTVVDILESARRLLCPELVGDTVVAGVVDGQCLSNKLLWRDRRRCSFWFFFLVVLLIAVGHGLLSTVVLKPLADADARAGVDARVPRGVE